MNDPFRGAEIKSEVSDLKAEDPFAADVTGKNFLLPYEKENEVYAKNHLIMSEAFKETVIVVENVDNPFTHEINCQSEYFVPDVAIRVNSGLNKFIYFSSIPLRMSNQLSKWFEQQDETDKTQNGRYLMDLSLATYILYGTDDS